MQAYKTTLDKINWARDKTESVIVKIKALIGKVEADTLRVEGGDQRKVSASPLSHRLQREGTHSASTPAKAEGRQPTGHGQDRTRGLQTQRVLPHQVIYRDTDENNPAYHLSLTALVVELNNSKILVEPERREIRRGTP